MIAIPATRPPPLRRWRLSLPKGPAGLLLLTLVFYALLLFWPLVGVLRSSLQPDSGPSTAEYTRFFSDPLFRAVLRRTISLSLIVTGLAAILGFPIAAYLARPGNPGRSAVTFAIIAPMLISAVARSYGWIIILGPEGMLAQLGAALGIADPASHLLFTETGLVIATVHLMLPLMVLPIAGSLQQIDPSLERAAAILGAGFWRIFFKVTLPLTIPGMSAGAVIVFCMAASSYVTPALIGGSTIPMMSYVIYQQAIEIIDWPFASAISMILLCATATVTLVYFVWSGRQTRHSSERAA